MPRKPTGTWDGRSKRYYSKLGPADPATEKRSAVMLCYEDGRPVAFGDEPGKAAAIWRLQQGIGKAEESARKGPTVAEVVRAFVAWQVERGAAKRTVTEHHRNLRRFATFVHHGARYADLPAAAIVPNHLYAIKNAGIPARNIYVSVAACWSWAFAPIEGREPERMIPENRLAKIKIPKAGSRGDAVIPWETSRRLLRVARGLARGRNPHDRRHEATRHLRRARVLCVHLIAACGCRPNEAAGLKWSEIDWQAGIVAVSQERDKGRRPGQAPKKPRRFAVPPRLLQALAALRRQKRANATWAFALDHRDRPPHVHELIAWWREWLRPGVIAAGVPIPPKLTMYWFRHSAISDTINGGGNLDVIGQQFGNSRAVIESTYAHAADSVRRAVADEMARARRKRG